MIGIDFENSESEICKDLDEAREAVLNAHASEESATRIHDCDGHGNDSEGGQEYGCEWDVKLVAIGAIKRMIKLPVYGIVLERGADQNWRLMSDLKRRTCPFCNEPNCCIHCDESAEKASHESYIHEDAVMRRLTANGALDAIESLVLAQVCAGIDVETPAYLESIETAIDAIGNNT